MNKWLRKIKSSFMKRYYIITNGGYSIGKSYGVFFLFDWRHSIDKKVANRLYEDSQLVFMQEAASMIRPNYFFDVGAHAGLYSLVVQKACDSTEVHAFEPDAQNFCQLNANLYLNQYYSKLHVHNYAVSSKSGYSHFDRSEETSRGTRQLSEDTGVEIEIKSLDDIFSFEGCSLFMKIDVEGHERSVIAGARNLLTNNNCLMLIEASPESVKELRKILGDFGYEETMNGQFNDYLFKNHNWQFSE